MFSRIFSRIQNKLLVSFFAVSVIPLISVGIFCYITISESMIDIVLDSELDEVVASGEAANLFLENILNDTIKVSKLESLEHLLYARQISSKKDIKQYTKEVAKDILNIIEIREAYYHIEFIDENGVEAIRYNNNYDGIQPCHPEALQDKSATDFFKETKALGRGKVRVSEIHLNEENNKIESAYIPVVSYSKSLYYSNGEFAGIINLSAYADKFLEKLSETEDDEPAFHYLTDSEGYFLHHPDPLKLWGKCLNTQIRFETEFPDIDAGMILNKGTGSIDSGKHLISYISIVPPGQNVKYWKLISMQEKDETLEPLYEVRLVIIVVTGIALLTAMVIAIILARNISIPIQKIVYFAEQVSISNFNVHIDINSKDEIGQLAVSIHRMRLNLHKAILRLRKNKARNTVKS